MKSKGSSPVGNRVKDLRKDLHLTQQELADKSGLTKNTIFRIEKGSQKPKMENIIKLAKSLNVTPNDILLG